tara:strand:- start:1444 stop:3309 length:1866 start_codon:yes stop_codon:yes gene_type:complete
MAELKRDIKYINKDFNSLRNRLIEYTKTYFPNTFNDFSPASTGMLFMEMAAYVGDVLSFYIDNQIQETYIQRAKQLNNILDLAYLLGYRPKITTAATVDIQFFQQLPAKTVGTEKIPDYSYALRIPADTTVTSNTRDSLKFIIEDEIDFTFSSSLDPTAVSVYQLSGTEPEFFLLEKTRQAISATINTTEFAFGSPVKFDTRSIAAANIIGILDIIDSDGNEYFEVPNLAQESVFDSIKNTNPNDPNTFTDTTANNLLKLKKVQRRFTTRFLDRGTLQIEFGAGTTADNDEEIVPNPNNVGLGLPFQQDKLTTAFSPTNFVFTDTYGIAPSNTTLTVRYLTGGGVGANAAANTLTNVDNAGISFANPNLVNNPTLANTIFASVASSNLIAADGGSDGDTVEEIRQNALANFQNQLRTVTPQDYLIRALSLPPEFGTIAKAFTMPTQIGELNQGETPTVLDLYVISQDANGNFANASNILQRNLRTYLSEYRMVGDSIRIKNAFIINIGVEFEIVARPNFNNNQVLTDCISALRVFFARDNFEINEPILLTDINTLLSRISGVQTVKDIKIINKTGESLGYSNFAYDIDGATINQVVYPSIDPMIFEVKFPSEDIRGRVVPL